VGSGRGESRGEMRLQQRRRGTKREPCVSHSPVQYIRYAGKRRNGNQLDWYTGSEKKKDSNFKTLLNRKKGAEETRHFGVSWRGGDGTRTGSVEKRIKERGVNLVAEERWLEEV